MRNVAYRPHTNHPQKYGLLPYRRRNTGAASPKVIGVEITPRYASIQKRGGGVTLLNPKYPTGIPPGDTIKL